MRGLLGTDPSDEELRRARLVSSLPVLAGDLGLRSATRTAPAAWWASWADALGMLRARHPGLAASIMGQLALGPQAEAQCIREVTTARDTLVAEGFTEAPSWEDLAAGARPPNPESDPAAPLEREPGDWQRGWQRAAAGARESHARREQVLPQLSHAGRALLRSQSGPGSGRVFTVVPSSPLTEVPAAEMRVLLLRRVRLPLRLSERSCRCRRFLDPLGDHLRNGRCAGRR